MGLHARLAPVVFAAALSIAAELSSAPPLPAAAPRRFRRASPASLVFQSDIAGRPAIYTLHLATGAVARLSGRPARGPRPTRAGRPTARRVVFASNRAHYDGADA